MPTKATRSPNSPSKPFGGCFEDAMKLYDAFPHASFDHRQIASVLGRSAGSGGFKSLLSDLKQYGLIEKGPSGDLIISQALREMSLASASEKDSIGYSLATRPSIFERILDDQGYHLPDSPTLANVLVAKFDFNKEKAAKTAKALRESLEWVHAIDAKGNVLPPKCEASSEIGDLATMPEIGAVGKVNGADEAEEAAYREKGFLTTDVPVKGGRVVHVKYPQDLTLEEAKKVGAVLSALTQ